MAPPGDEEDFIEVPGIELPAMLDRFLNLIEVGETECWLWGGATAWGYGRFRVGEGLVQAHRFSYEHFVRPLRPDEEIDHLCRVRACVNPAHLEPVDHRTNMRRGEGGPGRNARKTHCVRGHEFTPENTYIRKDGKRNCRACWTYYREQRHARR